MDISGSSDPEDGEPNWNNEAAEADVAERSRREAAQKQPPLGHEEATDATEVKTPEDTEKKL